MSKAYIKYEPKNGETYGCYKIIDIGPFFIESQPNRAFFKVQCTKCNKIFFKRRDFIYKPPSKCRNCANKENFVRNKERNLINRKGYCKAGHRGVGGLSKTQFSKFKWSAKKRNIFWDDNVTLDYLWNLYEKQQGKCALSGMDIKITGEEHEPITNKNGNINTSLDLTASLDRIDSSRGYEIGNLQWLHVRVNFMKNVFNQEEFIQICTKIALTHKKKKYE